MIPKNDIYAFSVPEQTKIEMSVITRHVSKKYVGHFFKMEKKIPKDQHESIDFPSTVKYINKYKIIYSGCPLII